MKKENRKKLARPQVEWGKKERCCVLSSFSYDAPNPTKPSPNV